MRGLFEMKMEKLVTTKLALPIPFDSETMLENYNWLLKNPGKRPKLEDSFTEENSDIYERFHPYISDDPVRYGGLEFEYFLGAYVGGLPPQLMLPANK